ncbi:MAG: 5-formyltetrahydrofolate cyclo-ligase, partial [Acidiferrobacterales bacterium]
FAPAAPGTVLVANHFGILEPAAGRRDLVRAQKLDLILLPLVGFDPRGNRLGVGAGFYDRTLAILRHRKHWRKPHLIGLAHDLQRIDQLDSDPWDIALQAIVTDEQVYAMPKETNA